MTDQPILLFLHGVGDGDPGNKWRSRLELTLIDLGYADLTAVKVIAPRYAHALKGWDERVPLAPFTSKQPSREAARQNRREFERRIGALEYRLGRHDKGNGLPGFDAAVNVAVAFPVFKQARNYLGDPEIRAQVLHRILDSLPDAGRVVIVGHSLGSVIAADLVRRLPRGLEVVGMVTIGSPLAHAGFNLDKLRDSMSEPPVNLSWWVNFWNVPDMVAAHRGVSSVFPWMVDFRIDTKVMISKQAHAATEYLGQASVGEAIGYALFGSRSKEIAIAESGADIPLDATELLALLALRYAHLIASTLEGDKGDRFAGALRAVQAAAIEEIALRNTGEGRAIPSAVARLAFDMSDPDAAIPVPTPGEHIPKEDAVPVMTILAGENLIRPFEVSIADDKRRDAMKELTAEMGLGSQFGADVFASAEAARAALSDGGVNWVKWGALGAGAVAIVVATGGLALAAAPGLVGAAVLTSALASFGPGGMIGGLLTAGTLVTAGGGGIAFGLASPATSAETLEAIIERRLAAAILRQQQGLESDPAVWQILTEAEIEVRREHERLDEFSDESAPGLKLVKRKITTIERALRYLRENGLEPGAGEAPIA
ncbi:alpha/beta hydrolase [Planococcus sp. APC 4015]|nr:alpha/beta hydrolase [Planococcus sp. APC 4015]